MAQIEDVRSYWDGRADLGFEAGSGDVMLKRLEIDAIASYVSDGLRILDVGCGNGFTAIEIARRYQVEIVGLDYAPKMIDAAIEAAEKAGLKDRLEFRIADIQDLPDDLGRFNLVYGERVLINLQEWSTQLSALRTISRLLEPDGRYVMCESSQDGLDTINRYRESAGLDAISSPWHNRYLRDEEVQTADLHDLCLDETNDFSSTYYFLSRVVNAWLAHREGREPSYDAEVNQLATLLPSFGGMGQTKIWVWRKR